MAAVVVATSECITTLAEARTYYASNLAGTRQVPCQNCAAPVLFERDGTHLFSVEVLPITAIPAELLVTRNLGGGKRECRQFSLERARLMDWVIPAISGYTRAVFDKGPISRRTIWLHGEMMSCGRYIRVVLRPGRRNTWVALRPSLLASATTARRHGWRPRRSHKKSSPGHPFGCRGWAANPRLSAGRPSPIEIGDAQWTFLI